MYILRGNFEIKRNMKLKEDLENSCVNYDCVVDKLEEANRSFNSFHPISETNEILNVQGHREG